MTPSQPSITCICGNADCAVLYGYCHCGCGGKPKISGTTDHKRGYVAGAPRRFLAGHNPYTGPRYEGRQQDRYQARLRVKNLCIGCGQRPPRPKRLKCETCAAKNAARCRRYHKEMNPVEQRFCKTCGQETIGNQVFCEEHRWRACEVCGKRFETDRGSTRKVRFCSRRCTGISRQGIVPKGFGKSGPDAPNWKGGKTKPWLLKRETPELRKWTKQVYQRDDWTCQDCGARGVTLHAHHIKSFSKHPELRTDLTNGVTLCVPCHSKRHGHKIATLRFYGKGKVGQMKLFNRRIS